MNAFVTPAPIPWDAPVTIMVLRLTVSFIEDSLSDLSAVQITECQGVLPERPRQGGPGRAYPSGPRLAAHQVAARLRSACFGDPDRRKVRSASGTFRGHGPKTWDYQGLPRSRYVLSSRPSGL